MRDTLWGVWRDILRHQTYSWSKEGYLCQSPKPNLLKWLLNLGAPNSEVTDVPRVLWPFCHHQLFGDVLTDRSIWGRVEKYWSQEEAPDKSTLEVTLQSHRDEEMVRI